MSSLDSYKNHPQIQMLYMIDTTKHHLQLSLRECHSHTLKVGRGY